MSFFITFEGVEGCGKSTQSRILKNRLSRMKVPVLLTHEPGVTPLGERITRLLKWAKHVPVSPIAELLLFNVSRAQLVGEVIKPALNQGTIVICDRYADSTTAYQGYARGLDMEMVARANEIGKQGLEPDMTILLDMPFESGMVRKQGETPDRFEQETAEFHHRVRQGYLQLAAAHPERWKVFDALQDKTTISNIIWEMVRKLTGLPE